MTRWRITVNGVRGVALMINSLSFAFFSCDYKNVENSLGLIFLLHCCFVQLFILFCLFQCSHSFVFRIRYFNVLSLSAIDSFKHLVINLFSYSSIRLWDSYSIKYVSQLHITFRLFHVYGFDDLKLQNWFEN